MIPAIFFDDFFDFFAGGDFDFFIEIEEVFFEFFGEEFA